MKCVSPFHYLAKSFEVCYQWVAFVMAAVVQVTLSFLPPLQGMQINFHSLNTHSAIHHASHPLPLTTAQQGRGL